MTTALVERVRVAEESVERSPAQLRLLIAQGVDLEAAVPAALQVLHENPLIEAEFFPGDLLQAVLRLPATFWEGHQDLWLEAHSVLDRLDNAVRDLGTLRAGFVSMGVRDGPSRCE